MKSLYVLTGVMLVLFLTAPIVEAQKRRAAPPTEATVGAGLRLRVVAESDGALSLASFRKTNGYEKGFGLYVIEWQAEVMFEQAGYKPGNTIIGYWQDFRVLEQQPRGLDAAIGGGNTIHFNKGQQVRLTGDSVLRKTEQGWRLEGLSVKTAQLIEEPIANGPVQGRRYVASNSKFSYIPPDGWILQDNPGSKYKVATLKAIGGFQPNMNVGADIFPGTLDEYSNHILRVLKSGYETFVALAKSEFTTDVSQTGTKIIAELESGGKRFRLNIYIFAGRDDQKFMVTCSALEQGWETYDKLFDKSLKTFKAPA
jgi:hypothetical protein